jgi:hypothetical protein
MSYRYVPRERKFVKKFFVAILFAKVQIALPGGIRRIGSASGSDIRIRNGLRIRTAAKKILK